MMKTIVKRTISVLTASLQRSLTAAQGLSLAALCSLLLASGALAQEQQPEQPPTPEEPTAESSTMRKALDPNKTVTPVAPGNQSALRGKPSDTVDGDIIFTSPGQFLYPRDIRLSDNFGVLRLFGADSLTSSPAGAAIQLFGNNAENFNGQLFLDSGAHDNAALIFRTGKTGETLAERMRVTSDGRVLIGPANQFTFSRLNVGAGSATSSIAVSGDSTGAVGFGVRGDASGGSGTGVYGSASGREGDGVRGEASGILGIGVRGRASGTGGIAVRGDASGNASLAGRFVGNVEITGNLTKGSGTFKIDHPLDPENRYLSHSFVESPDMMNIYNGNVTLDRRGRAVVTLPTYFEALNREFRYQLTALGAPANLYIAAEIKGNTFKVAGGKPGMKVSWLVTGVRQDAYAEKHRIKVEEDKPAQERGTYLHPEAFGQPAEKGVSHAKHSAPAQQAGEAASARVNDAERTARRQRRVSQTRR